MRRDLRPAHELFFPAAAAYAALILPLSVASMLGLAASFASLASPVAHAHEMLFGFALAAVAGNQLGPLPRSRLGLLFGAWIAARVLFVAMPASIVAALANALFAGLLALQLLPRVLAPIRKLRNRALPVAVLALCVAVIAMQAALVAGRGGAQQVTLLCAVLLLALLMLFMGGRIIAPAAAGHMYRAGSNLAARVQPRLEGALVVLLACATAAVASDAHKIAGACLMLAGAAAAVRLARWRLWKVRGRADIHGLAIGYAWVVLGIAAIGAALAWNRYLVAAVHLVTVGAIGTLTINVMALTYARLARRDASRQALPVIATIAIAVSTVLRVLADVAGDRAVPLLAAAGFWSAAFVLLLIAFSRLRIESPGS